MVYRCQSYPPGKHPLTALAKTLQQGQQKGRTGSMSHTPGPWKVKHEQHGCLYIGSEQYPVAMTSREPDAPNDSDSIRDADAWLIAAAPALLTALQNLMRVASQTTQDLIAFEGAQELDAAIDAGLFAVREATQEPR